MKRYSQRNAHSAMAELNVTPLLDLAFVLLIIFIITTPLMENSIPLQLPQGSANNNTPPDPKSIRTVSLDQNGQVYLEDRPINLTELKQALITFRKVTPDAAVIVRADKSLRYQRVVDVVNVLQEAEITRMHLENVTP